MAVDYTHHDGSGPDGSGPDGGGRDGAGDGARGAAVPFVVRTAGSRGPARTLADHLAAASPPSPPSTRAPAAPSAAPAPTPAPGGPPRPGAGPVFVWRARGGSSPRTLADHLHPAAGPAPAAPPAQPPAAPPAQAAPPRAPAARAAVVGEARESERRTVLDADDPVLTLRAADLPRAGRLTATLRWEPPRTPAGVQSSTDVHLGCLWQTATDHSGVVQSTGSLLSAPGFGARQVLRLGPRSEGGGEALTVDLTTVDSMRRLLLFATGHRRQPSWGALGVHLVLALPSGAQVLLWVDEPEQPSLSVAIASVHLVDGDLVVRREDEPVPGPAREVALAYGWDLDWSADGTVPRR